MKTNAESVIKFTIQHEKKLLLLLNNLKDREKHGTLNYATGEKVRSAKINEEIAKEIYSLKGKLSLSEIGKIYGLFFTTVHAIHQKKTWKCIHEG